MSFPLNLWAITVFLAITAVILVITSELLSPYYGKTDIRISKKRFRNAAFAVSILFLAAIIVRIVSIVIIR